MRADASRKAMMATDWGVSGTLNECTGWTNQNLAPRRATTTLKIEGPMPQNHAAKITAGNSVMKGT
jgi:hypothetical protein